MKIHKPLIIYDPKCSICLNVKTLLMRFDRSHRLDFISLYQTDQLNEIPFLKLEECYGKVHLVGVDYQIYQGPKAVEEILRLIWPLLNPALRLKFVKNSLAISYDLLNAYRLKKRGSCEMCGQ
jgi:predicted DCC family thiol-disulfide oxidoreductase YuxK